MNLGDFHISIKKILNGYVVSYPITKVKAKAANKEMVADYERDPFMEQMFGKRKESPMETVEWYVPSRAKLEEVLPRLMMECYHSSVTLKDEA